MFARSKGIGLDVQQYVDSGHITVTQIDPAEIPPGEFVAKLREAVETRKLSVLVIDSLNGYMNAMPEEHFLTIQMHEVLTYLGQQGVATILVVAQHGIATPHVVAPVDVSYLADTVVLFRYFELAGQLRKAVSVMKKRSGTHESAIRAFSIGANGLEVGAPLNELRGVLAGTPVIDLSLRMPDGEQVGNSRSGE
jgi:circadian clock protein KaiC